MRYGGDDPVFITTLEANLDKVHNNLLHGDVEMMKKRLTLFRFTSVIQAPDRTIVPCPHCFAELVLKHADGPTLPLREAGPARGEASGEKRCAPQPAEGQGRTKAMREMNVGEVVSWLCEIELGHLAPRFRENGVDGACNADLARQEFVSELG